VSNQKRKKNSVKLLPLFRTRWNRKKVVYCHLY